MHFVYFIKNFINPKAHISASYHLFFLGFEDGLANRCICALTDHLAHHVILFELHGQVREVGEQLAALFEAAGKREAGEHLIVLILEL